MSVASLPTPRGRQKEVLYLPATGHTVVLGTAGSGKTTLAIHRSFHLTDAATDHCGRTLLVTYNRCLVTYMKHLATRIRADLDVTNYHRFARGYLSSRGKMGAGSVCNDRLSLIRAVVAAAAQEGISSPVLQRPVEFLDDEIAWLQQHGIKDAAAYVAAERIGRSASRLPRIERPALFDIYRRYLALRQRRWDYDWEDLASAALAELNDDPSPRQYRHVVIDEGQDFSPEMLRSLAAAVPPNGSLTFFGDTAQQIYGQRMSWRSAGLRPAKIWPFKQNYRNTRQIANLALALAGMPAFPDDPDLVEPEAPTADGPPPTLLRCETEEEEIKLVATRATDLARTGTVAILARTRKLDGRIRLALPAPATELHRDLQRWSSEPGLFHGTYHSAKGLEFDTVFLPFLSEARWPHPPDVAAMGTTEAARRDSRLLYVGITRARSTLALTYTGRLTSLLPTWAPLYRP